MKKQRENNCPKCGHKFDIFGDCDFCAEAERVEKKAAGIKAAIISAYENIGWEDYTDWQECQSIGKSVGIDALSVSKVLQAEGLHISAQKKAENKAAAKKRRDAFLAAESALWARFRRVFKTLDFEKALKTKNLYISDFKDCLSSPDKFELTAVTDKNPYFYVKSKIFGNNVKVKVFFPDIKIYVWKEDGYAGDAAYGWEGPNSVD